MRACLPKLCVALPCTLSQACLPHSAQAGGLCLPVDALCACGFMLMVRHMVVMLHVVVVLHGYFLRWPPRTRLAGRLSDLTKTLVKLLEQLVARSVGGAVIVPPPQVRAVHLRHHCRHAPSLLCLSPLLHTHGCFSSVRMGLIWFETRT